MSALPPKAENGLTSRYVRIVPGADKCTEAMRPPTEAGLFFLVVVLGLDLLLLLGDGMRLLSYGRRDNGLCAPCSSASCR